MGGEGAIIAYCTELARHGGRLVASKLGTEVMDNDSHTHSDCCFTTVKLPIDMEKVRRTADVYEASQILSKASEQQAQQSLKEQEVGRDQKQESMHRSYGDLVRDRIVKLLVDEYCTFMAVVFYCEAWWVRLSAQIYLELEDFAWSANVLKEVCAIVETTFADDL